MIDIFPHFFGFWISDENCYAIAIGRIQNIYFQSNYQNKKFQYTPLRKYEKE